MMQNGSERPNTRDMESAGSYDTAGKRKSFRRLFTRFAEKTSMQGVPYINTAKFWWAKIIWTILLLGALVVMTLHLWYLFNQYLSWPVNTKVALGFQTLAFPQVTICNTNTLHKKRFDSFDGSEELKWLVRDLDPENFVSDQFSENYTFDTTTPIGEVTTGQGGGDSNVRRRRKRYIEEYQKFNISKYDSEYIRYEDEFLDSEEDYASTIDDITEIREIFTELFMDIDKYDREDLGHQISDMLVDCSFNGRRCTADQFKLHQTSEYGNCWTLSNPKFRVKKAGPTTGLSLTLFLETDEYLKGITTGYGARISIQKPNTYPFPADRGLFIPASMETDIGLKLVNITRLGGNYGTCEKGDDFMRLYNISYTRRACQAFCQITTVIKNCSCFDDYWEEFAFNRDKTLRPCRSETEVKCLLRVEQLYYDGKLTCTCNNPCSEVSYIRAISQRQWPTNEYARVLLEWVCDRDFETCENLRRDLDELWTINNNFLKLNIYYEDLNFENITETAEIELQQFLSDVGGAIGLWIGLSILSLCEVIQLFVELCYYGVYKTTQERQYKKSREGNRRKNNERWHDENVNNKQSRWPSTAFGVRDVPRKDRERSGYHSDDDGRNLRRYDDPFYKIDSTRDRYEKPRDRYDDQSDRYSSRRYDRPDLVY